MNCRTYLPALLIVIFNGVLSTCAVEPSPAAPLGDTVELRIKHSDVVERRDLIYSSMDQKVLERFAKWFSVKKGVQDRGDWAPDTSIYFIKSNGKARIIYLGRDAWSDGSVHEWAYPEDFRKEFKQYLMKERKNAVVWDDEDPSQADPPKEE